MASNYIYILYYEPFTKKGYGLVISSSDDFNLDIYNTMKNPYDKQIGGTHYQKFKIQPSKFVIENELLYPEGCVIKYILRHRLKGKKEDLKKAIHFIEMIIERDYSDV